jgi:response regulator RpfG family c-di-GMP phosphodiesterase
MKEDSSDGKLKALKLARIILFLALAIAVNILLNRIVKTFAESLYLDSVGTMLAAILGGSFPGVVVGYLTNIINMTADQTNLYYASISVLIAVATYGFAKKGFFDKFWKALVTIPALAFIGGILGSVLTYFIFGSDVNFWHNFLLDIIDKAITVVIVFAVVKLIPEKMKKSLFLSAWQQRPLSDGELAEMKEHKTKKLNLRRKITIILTVVMVLVSSVTVIISCFLYDSFAVGEYKTLGTNVARLAADIIDPDKVDSFIAEGERAEGYAETRDHLYTIISNHSDIEYIYAYKITEDGCRVVFDIDPEGTTGSAPGELIPFDESFAEYIPTLLAGGTIEPVISDDTYGWLLTNYEPVRDSKGRTVCYAASDISMDEIRADEIVFMTKLLSLFVGLFILALAFCMWAAKYCIVFPLNAMTVASADFTYKSREERIMSVKRLENLSIRTGDEVENLYESLSHTIAETVSYMENLREKSVQLTKIQNGLIYVLADLVESRDKNTGDHVRKTTAFTKAILSFMNEDGLYPQIVTKQFVTDVTNSAPLHDVGKIKISDVILNKPARLSDEEFEVMKTHTRAGGEIIENAMELVANPGYLREAKNLALYHHEKWDGSGYPQGLSGDRIPISARVMAIADVFDALLSKRSYKEPFSFDEAVSVIKDGSGKHFDPQIVEVFLNHLDEIHDIADEHERILASGSAVVYAGLRS